MKILTKEWREQYEQVRVINWLKEVDTQKKTYEEILKDSREIFYKEIHGDLELAELAFKDNLAEKLYNAHIDRDRKTLLSLPTEVYSKIKDIKTVILGFACKEDKEMLMEYASSLRKELEKRADEAGAITEEAIDCLPEEIDLDSVMGELVYEVEPKGKDYFINVDGYIICVENYEIIEQEEFELKIMDFDDPVSEFTSLDAAELHFVNDNCFELHLLFAIADKFENMTYKYLTLRGTNVKFVNED